MLDELLDSFAGDLSSAERIYIYVTSLYSQGDFRSDDPSIFQVDGTGTKKEKGTSSLFELLTSDENFLSHPEEGMALSSRLGDVGLSADGVTYKHRIGVRRSERRLISRYWFRRYGLDCVVYPGKSLASTPRLRLWDFFSSLVGMYDPRSTQKRTGRCKIACHWSFFAV